MARLIGMWGQFGGEHLADGQAVRTNTIYEVLVKRYGAENINIATTYNWKKHKIRFLIRTIKLYFKSKNIIILPADNGLKVVSKLYNFLGFFSKRNIIYIVIGGFLPGFLSNNKKYVKYIKKYKSLLVQSQEQVDELHKLGIGQAEVFPNFKNITPVLVNYEYSEQIKLCFFSRITKDKGIEDAIDSTKLLRSKHGVNAILDIYGMIDPIYKDSFYELLEKYKDFISYKGIIEFNKTPDTLSKYYCILFPTYYYGEGHPGAIVDAFFSGIPIIASDWKYNKEFVKDGVNGFIVEIKNPQQICEKVLTLINNNILHSSMKVNSHELAQKYDSKKIIEKLIAHIK